MMKAYLILAHKYPAQLRRLVRALDDDKSFFFIHVDLHADLAAFENLQPWAHKINFVQREKAEWAGYGLVQAILNGLQSVIASPHEYSHVILLSGQDYPIRSNEYIHSFLQHHKGRSFIEFNRLPAPGRWPNNGGLYRVNKYFIGMKPWQLFCSRSLNFLSRPLPFLQRRIYNNMVPYAGSMWWIFSMDAVRYIHNFTKQHPGYAAFHRYTFAADEVFFHTILLNQPDKAAREAIINDDKRFIRWKDINASHPEILFSRDVEIALKSGAVFARKFDVQIDDYALELIDAERNQPSNEYAPTI